MREKPELISQAIQNLDVALEHRLQTFEGGVFGILGKGVASRAHHRPARPRDVVLALRDQPLCRKQSPMCASNPSLDDTAVDGRFQ